ncbi:hypothetical protein LRE50_16305 (plasmid) [Clavibacter sepedonicus]|uniref:hypothetical protein n=1 Tax=Clavibacter sepedonicus TaxID=31964 RepID=UPI00211A6BA2|nr:hypothetical protein [Clavibacter sepedonicus]UUK67320.1 hypothetical protein LRE50_16305 [Clavibacter sepedonicus]
MSMRPDLKELPKGSPSHLLVLGQKDEEGSQMMWGEVLNPGADPKLFGFDRPVDSEQDQ